MRNVDCAGPVTVTSCHVLDRPEPWPSLEENLHGVAPANENSAVMAQARTPNADRAIREVAAGRPVILYGGPEQNGEADLVFAAALSTTALMTSCVRLTGGLVGVAVTAEQCDQLRLPPQHWSQFAHRRPQCVAVDAVGIGIGTGISAKDRSATAQILADPYATAEQLTRPGHVIPLRAGIGSDYVDAAVRLALLAGQSGAAVVSRLVSEEEPITMAHVPEIYRIANRHQLRTITVAEVLDCAATSRPQRLASAPA
jgi:3,4-dihydroxy 2-butanone 4-phosphate synthase/GTP cyclohydrolase II